MKSPIDIVRGRIVDIDKPGTVTIKAPYDDWPMLLKREYKECNIQMIDSRPLSDKQRRTCYKLIREISNYTGMGLDPTKEYMKLKFIAEDLQETQVICIVNLGTMKMGPEKSEVLVLGVSDGSGGTIPLTTEKRVDNGECVF